MRPSLQLVWFKRDLRVTDHAPLLAAARTGDPVLPLWIVEPELWSEPDASARQYEFHAETASALRHDLARLGQPLVVRTGDAVAVLDGLAQSHPIAAVHAHQETTGAWGYARDRRVLAWARARGIPVNEHRQNGAIRALPTRDGWAREWHRFVSAPEHPCPAALSPCGIDPGPIPTAAELGLPADPCPGRQPAGRDEAEALLASFLADRAETYRWAMSSPLEGETACSRLSPHLAAGSLSIREAVQSGRLARRALDGRIDPTAQGLRQGIDSYLTRLAWHCHFMQKLETDPTLETRELHRAYRGLERHPATHPHFARWAEGRTGWPFVDACMRSLAATGWLNFRMRAMLTSVATMHLWLDWRPVGLHLARRFTDYEPGIHWSQVQMQSGSTGVNTIRMYNPVKQGMDQDPEGRFTRAWCPELACLPDRWIHTPWLAPEPVLREAGVVLDATWPRPPGDHQAMASEARDALWSLRRGQAFRRAASEVQALHGSRRSGLSRTGRRAAPRAAQAQPELPWTE